MKSNKMAKMNNKKIGAEGQASGNTIPLLSQFSIVIVKTEKEQQIFVCVKLDGRHLWQSSGKLLCGGRKYSKSIVPCPPCGCNLTIDIITASCISMSHTIRPQQSSCIRRCHHAWGLSHFHLSALSDVGPSSDRTLGSPQTQGSPLPQVFAKSKALVGCRPPHWSEEKFIRCQPQKGHQDRGLFWSANWFCRLVWIREKLSQFY